MKYRSAGTVEFVVGADRSFYFLEMNTRLQVEHPVTEMITGLDLVELMIRVAAGEKLPFRQDEIPLLGWAIEARINAEDPSRNFLPSTGRLVQFRPPAERAGEVRVDTGVFEGGEVSMYYDSMIAKLIAHGTSRDEARGRLAEALDAFVVKGPASNIAFLGAVARHPRFAAGKFNTGFIAEEFPQGYAPSTVPIEDPSLFISVAAAVHWRYAERSARIAGQVPGHERDVGDARVVHLRGVTYPVRVRSIPGGQEVFLEGNSFAVQSGWKLGEPVFSGTLNGKRINVRLERAGMKYRLAHAGVEATALVLTEHAAKMQALMPHKPPPDLSKFLLSPMPGLLTELAVEPRPGDQGRREAGGDRGDEDGERAAGGERRGGEEAAREGRRQPGGGSADRGVSVAGREARSGQRVRAQAQECRPCSNGGAVSQEDPGGGQRTLRGSGRRRSRALRPSGRGPVRQLRPSSPHQLARWHRRRARSLPFEIACDKPVRG